MTFAEQLRATFELDPHSGLIYFKERYFDPSFNKRWAGARCVPYKRGRQYYVYLFKKRYRYCDVIWSLYYGAYTPGVYHADGNPKNNRISNLRAPGKLIDLNIYLQNW